MPSLEEVLHKIYGVAMTPLPPPPQLDVEKLLKYLQDLKTPEIPELPTAPKFMNDYLKQRGLLTPPPGILSDPGTR